MDTVADVEKLYARLVETCRDMVEVASSYLHAVSQGCDHAVLYAEEIKLDSDYLAFVAKELHDKHVLKRNFGCKHPRGEVTTGPGKEEEE